MAGKDPSTRTPTRPKLPAPRRPSPPNAPSGSTSEPVDAPLSGEYPRLTPSPGYCHISFNSWIYTSPPPKKLSTIFIRFFWLQVLILPSCLTVSGEKAKKSCSVCSYKFAVADPHPTCLKHNTTCFRQYEFIPEGCIHCSYLIKKFKEGEKKQQAVFLARIDAMQHKISYLAKSNPDRLPERVKNRFLAGDKNPFAPHMRHLDPRPRTSRSLTRERSSTPLPPLPTPVEAPRAEPDALASAVAQAGIDLFADSSDHPPFPGFESSRASPDYQPCPDSPRHRFDDNEYGHDYSRSSSPEPPRKMPRRGFVSWTPPQLRAPSP